MIVVSRTLTEGLAVQHIRKKNAMTGRSISVIMRIRTHHKLHVTVDKSGGRKKTMLQDVFQQDTRQLSFKGVLSCLQSHMIVIAPPLDPVFFLTLQYSIISVRTCDHIIHDFSQIY